MCDFRGAPAVAKGKNRVHLVSHHYSTAAKKKEACVMCVASCISVTLRTVQETGWSRCILKVISSTLDSCQKKTVYVLCVACCSTAVGATVTVQERGCALLSKPPLNTTLSDTCADVKNDPSQIPSSVHPPKVCGALHLFMFCFCFRFVPSHLLSSPFLVLLPPRRNSDAGSHSLRY